MVETLADIGEFGLIRKINELIQKEGYLPDRLSQGIGDDCASFTPREGYELLVTCDCLIEGRHYIPEYTTPMDTGRRAMSVNISDIGAMGGIPLYAVVSLGLKRSTALSDVLQIYKGFIRELEPFNAAVIGGNLGETEESNFIDITLIGEVEKKYILRRSTARAGDVILVTGFPGQSSMGMEILKQSDRPDQVMDQVLVKAYNRPSNRAREGRAVALSGLATAMIDISDGLFGDLGHICRESGLGAQITKEKLPVSESIKEAAKDLGRDPYDLVLQNSDDYELIITCPAENAKEIRSIIKDTSRVQVNEIGFVTDQSEGIRMKLPDNSVEPNTAKGWDHFKNEKS